VFVKLRIQVAWYKNTVGVFGVTAILSKAEVKQVICAQLLVEGGV
jgi:hypothetical protein